VVVIDVGGLTVVDGESKYYSGKELIVVVMGGLNERSGGGLSSVNTT
jgi:hypothetical protein